MKTTTRSHETFLLLIDHMINFIREVDEVVNLMRPNYAAELNGLFIGTLDYVITDDL
jgi:hypothetical protein